MLDFAHYLIIDRAYHMMLVVVHQFSSTAGATKITGIIKLKYEISRNSGYHVPILRYPCRWSMTSLWHTLILSRIDFAKKTTDLTVTIKIPAGVDFLAYALSRF
jgi:hypothetical protein